MNKLILTACLIIGCAGLTACNDSNNSKSNTKKLTSDEVQKVIVVNDPEREAENKELMDKWMK